VRYDLARSGVPRLPMEHLGLKLADVIAVEPYDTGWRPVMEAIAARHGLPAESVVTTHACSMANHLAYAAFVEPGDHVVIETPVYEPLARLVAYFGARAVPLVRREENGWRLDPDDVRRALTPKTTLVVLSNLQNPTGVCDDDDALAAVARIAGGVNAHVLVDEVYLDFLHAEGVRTAARLAPNVVATGSMTKAWGLDALRFGWVIAEPTLAERIRRLDELFEASTAHPSARIACHALKRSDEILAASNAMLNRNIALADAFVRSQPRLSWSRPRAGTCGLVRVDGIDVDVLSERLQREHDVAVVPGRFFEAPGHFRLAWCLETNDLETALARIGDAVQVLP
jgi:aspartate/methionine/tyrosine aminotransferase